MFTYYDNTIVTADQLNTSFAIAQIQGGFVQNAAIDGCTIGFSAPSTGVFTAVTISQSLAQNDISSSVATTDWINQHHYMTANQLITITGDAAGTGTNAINLTMPNIATAGTFNSVTINAKGQVTNGSIQPYLTDVSLSGDVLGSGNSAFAVVLSSVGTAGTYGQVVTDSKGRVISGSNPVQMVFVTGDVAGGGTWNNVAVALANVTTAGSYNWGSIDAKGRVQTAQDVPSPASTPLTVTGDATGTGNGAVNLTLASTGIIPGTYNSVTVDSKGRVTNATTQPYMTSAPILVVSGDATGTSNAGSLALTLANVGVAGTYNSVITDSAGRVVSGSDTVVLPDSGVTPGTYTTVVVNATGVVTFGSLSGANGTTSNAITLTGDITGNGASIIATALASVGTAGTYNQVATDTKGRVISGSNVPYVVGPLVFSGDASGTSVANAVSLTLANTAVTPGTYNTVVVDSKGRITNGSTVQQAINLGGDVSGIQNGVSITVTLANSGVAAGIYFNALTTVDQKGRVTSISNTTRAYTGDATGVSTLANGVYTTALTLANSGVTAGVYSQVTVNNKGVVTAGATSNATITVTGDVSGIQSGVGANIALTLANVATAGTYGSVTVNSKGQVTAGSNPSVILQGDIAGIGTVGSTIVTSLANSVAAGTYTSVTVNNKGIVTAGQSTTLGYLTNTSVLAYGNLPSELLSLPLAFGFSGQPAANAAIGISIVQQTTLPANFAGSFGFCQTMPTANAIFPLAYSRANAVTTVGAVAYTVGSHYASYGSASAVTLMPGDWLFLTAPATQDTTLSTVSVTILGGRV